MCYRPVMAKRSYDQTCGIASALDVIGERWTMLIVRDLLGGPRRYTDLLEALPGIGTNLLANRLKDLERYKIVCKRELPPPAASTVYELTEDGEELREPIMALGRWGVAYMEPPADLDEIPLRTAMMGFASLIRPREARDVYLRLGMVVSGGPPYLLSIDDGEVRVRQEDPAAELTVIHLPVEAMLALVTRAMTVEQAEEQGMLTIEGDRETLLRVLELTDASHLGTRFLEAVAAHSAA